MSDEMGDIAPDDLDDSEAAASVRAAWLGLIRLLAAEVVRLLDRDTSDSGEEATADTPGPAEPRPPSRDRPSRRSRNQRMS